MTSHRRVGSRAPLTGVVAAVLALLLLPSLALGADVEWTTMKRVSSIGNSRLDSLHQLSADRGKLHLVHPRVGPNATDDRIVYQRSSSGGLSWSRERTLFTSTSKRRHVVPNLAMDARSDVVAVAFRVNGPEQHSLFVRVSRDGGSNFGLRQEVYSTTSGQGVGIPAVAVGDDFIAVAWTNRANGKVKLRISRDKGKTFKPARTMARTSLSIDCKKKVNDGLVGLAAADRTLHVAWSHAPKRSCISSAIKSRTSTNRGGSWNKTRILTDRRSYGWPELDARNKTVMATVQSPSGGVIVARSLLNGRKWRDRLLKPARGHSFSAADVTLLPAGKAMMTYVDERIKNNKLVSTKVLSRRTPDDGASWKAPKGVAKAAKRLRMAPNIAANGKSPVIVLQSGPLDGLPRNIFVSRLR
jgi:hypothetical protein